MKKGILPMSKSSMYKKIVFAVFMLTASGVSAAAFVLGLLRCEPGLSRAYGNGGTVTKSLRLFVMENEKWSMKDGYCSSGALALLRIYFLVLRAARERRQARIVRWVQVPNGRR
jgi:hypothetical protein